MVSISRVNKIIELLEHMYPDAKCSLDFNDSLQLLVATQLSAQCTDVRVNKVTKELFNKYKDIEDYANANIEEFQIDILKTGFFRNKAKNIINCCKMLINTYDRKIPSNMKEMLTLPGVGRKTANLILGTVYDIPGIVVDTHAKRVSLRLGLTKSSNPNTVENDLMKVIPKSKWINFGHQMVSHGRAICKSRKPKCNICEIYKYCPYRKDVIE